MIGPTRDDTDSQLVEPSQLREIRMRQSEEQQQQPATEETGEGATRALSKRLAVIGNRAAAASMTVQQQESAPLKRRLPAVGAANNSSIRAKRKPPAAANANETEPQRQPRQTSSVLAPAAPAAAHQDNSNSNSNSNNKTQQKQQQQRLQGQQQQSLAEQQESARAPMIVCAACSKPIRERYLLEALDKQWHEDCLKCACCDCRLGEVGSSLFTQADKILCRRDFLRIFGQSGSCAACKKSIPPYELVMRANENAYHMDCFACQQCQYRFCVGDRFHLTDAHRIVCTLCHSEHQAASASSSTSSSSSSSTTIATSAATSSAASTSIPQQGPQPLGARPPAGQDGPPSTAVT